MSLGRRDTDRRSETSQWGSRVEVGADEDWTLHVLGKGHKARAVQLPQRRIAVLRVYRQTRSGFVDVRLL